MKISLLDELEELDRQEAQKPPAPHADAEAAVRRTPLRSRRLNPKATLFMPTVQPVADVIRFVFAQVNLVLAQSPLVLRTKLVEGPMGGASALIVEVPPDAMDLYEDLLELAKATLTEASDHSQPAYMLGRRAQPFSAFGDYGFQATLALLHPEGQDVACWDTYQRGSCPRPHCCRWQHPRSLDMAQLIVSVECVCE
jgi:hypothetical protein